MVNDDAARRTFFSISTSSLRFIQVKFGSFSSFNEFECSSDTDQRRMKWENPIVISLIGSKTGIGSNENLSDHSTVTKMFSSPSKTNAHENDLIENEHSNDEFKNDEPFSSFLSSSFGSNISKSFDWALETTVIESCQYPFECHCFPIHAPTAREQTKIARRDKNGGCDDLREILVSDGDENDEEESEDVRPFVPFILPPYCEYCGSPSIRNCQKFDPACKRPETFFPRAKPPFRRSITLADDNRC